MTSNNDLRKGNRKKSPETKKKIMGVRVFRFGWNVLVTWFFLLYHFFFYLKPISQLQKDGEIFLSKSHFFSKWVEIKIHTKLFLEKMLFSVFPILMVPNKENHIISISLVSFLLTKHTPREIIFSFYFS